MKAGHEHRAPLIDHITELRSRLMWSLAFILTGAVTGYFLRGQLLRIVQKPLNETLYYTDPTGALSFVIKICVVFGLLFGLPVVMYHLFAFLGPLLSRRTKRFTVFFTFLSVLLAVAGTLFAYFFTLPAALHFLVGFSSESIQSLITADEYFNFAFAYILGFALLFQIPLILLFINHITPLPPIKMIKALRLVVLVSFIIAAIITPTPDPINQTFMAAPAILLYLASIILIALVNRRKKQQPPRRSVTRVRVPTGALPVLEFYKPMPIPAQPRLVAQAQVISDFVS